MVTPETGNYVHKESRASVDYEAQLGAAHKHIVEEIFEAEFTDARMFDSVDAARLEPGLMAIFEPRIEQFSFASAKETGGIYCAVTIRYQIFIYRAEWRTGRYAHAHRLWQRTGAEDRQWRGRARHRGLRGDA